MTKKKKIILCIAVFAAVVVGIFSYSIARLNRMYDLVDKRELNNMQDSIESHMEDVDSTDRITHLLTDWCDVNNVKFTIDDNKNVIIRKTSSKTDKHTPTTVLAMEYNSKTFQQDISAYAVAEYFAKHGLNHGDVNVVFFYNDNNHHTGARNISKKYIPKKSRIILLTQGESSYISRSSFGNSLQNVSIPYKKVSRRCDSALRIRIGGIPTGVPSQSTAAQPNPISLLGNILTHLKSKSVSFQLADVKVESNGNMSPTGIQATILIDSYSMESVTTYLDDRIEDFEDDNKKDFPDSYYEYKELTEQLPNTAYSKKAVNRLITFLYTFKNGTYRFDKDNVPEGYKEKDIFGINSIQNLSADSSTLNLRINTMGMNDKYLKQVVKENLNAAELSDVKINTTITDSPYENTRNELFQLIQDAYNKANDISTVDATIPEKPDCGFTILTFLSAKNRNMDGIHLQITDKTAAKIANGILNNPIMDRNIFGF